MKSAKEIRELTTQKINAVVKHFADGKLQDLITDAVDAHKFEVGFDLPTNVDVDAFVQYVTGFGYEVHVNGHNVIVKW